MNISIAAEPIFHIGNFPVTNSLLSTWLVLIFIITAAVIIRFTYKKIPGGLQNFAEFILESFYNFAESIAKEKTKVIFPLTMTIFIFILFNNWAGLIPGVGSIGFWEELHGEKVLIPFFRSGSADLNTTLALALISVISIQYYGIKELGLFKYGSKFINFKSPVDFFVGILEIISEFSKIISFAFRLFGNVFAGEVLLTILAFLIPVLVTVPFLGLELFIGFVQALVFAVLTLVFINMAMVSHEQH